MARSRQGRATTRFGTGVLVMCGQDSSAGGIFGYWGCPWQVRDAIWL
ncbi:DUF6196 family protein [uncultured Tateyamaria sp.]